MSNSLRQQLEALYVNDQTGGYVPIDPEDIDAILNVFEANSQPKILEAEARGAKSVLSILKSEEGRLRQIANTVFYSAEYIAELEGTAPIPLEEFGDYHDYLAQLTNNKEQL